LRNLGLTMVNDSNLIIGTQSLHCKLKISSLLSLTQNGGLSMRSIVMVWFGEVRVIAIIILKNDRFLKLFCLTVRIKFDSDSIFDEKGFTSSSSVVRNKLF